MVTESFIREKQSTYTSHDKLFKELLHTFFEDFLLAFFPEVHKEIDFVHLQPISEEVHSDLIKGSTRRLDIVVQTRLKNEDAVVIVHVEPQNSKQEDFNRRMFSYFSLLYNKYQKPIIPIAIFSYPQEWDVKEFTISFPSFDVMRFQYKTLHLKKKNWREYIQTNNPVAAALLSKMGYTQREKIHVKLEFLRMMANMKLDEARQRLLYGFFETYLQLNDEEEEQLMKEIQQSPEAQKLMELPISYEERGIRKGYELGIEKGIERGIEKGIEKGIERVANEMLQKGIALELIADVTGLSIEKLVDWKYRVKKE